MKKFVMGLVFGIGLTLGIGAHAEVVSYVGKVIEGQFPVKVNGKEIESPGIVIDGTSYLPTRTIAELAGFDVKFNSDMGVELTKKEQYIPITNVTIIPSEEPLPDPKLDIQTRIDSINNRIKNLNHTLRVVNSNIERKDATEKARAEAIKQKEELEAKISELEAEKAELEAQLNAQ